MKAWLGRFGIGLVWVFLTVLVFATYDPVRIPLKISQPPRSAPFELTDLPPFPVQKTTPNLTLTAAAYTSLDVDSGEFLLSYKAHQTLPPASTSKLLLAYVVRRHCAEDFIITVATSYKDGTVIGLATGDNLTVGSLLTATLIPSANDAAATLAEGCFGTIPLAVAEMNKQAEEWHLNDSHFTNPTGLDEKGNLISAANLAWLGKLTTADPAIAQLVRTPSTQIFTVDGSRSFYLTSTNKLLGVAGIDGIKTGQTELAGGNLIASTSISGHRVITVVLGSTDRFAETLKLIAEIRRIYSWEVETNRNLGAGIYPDTIK
jgi:D-alanyl-D-alanine carboxypeptidase (penicillin-binding protein 5/6)